MYLTEVLTRSSSGAISHRCILLRESYREDGKVKNRTVANITHCSPEEIAAIRFALENKHDPSSLGSSRGFLPQDFRHSILPSLSRLALWGVSGSALKVNS